MNPATGLRVYGIAGCGFSGSTLLSFLLGSHAEVFCSGEACRAFRTYRRLLEHTQPGYYCSMHHDRCDFWTPEFLAECDAGDLELMYERIARFDSGKRVVVHSFKYHQVYSEMLCRSFPLHGLILLFKRPVAYYSSARIHRGSSIAEACNRYADLNREALKLCDGHGIPVFPLFYDDLATTTEDCLVALCEWMGLDYQTGMLEPWAVSDRTHMVSGNTGVFMHMWDEPVRDWILQSETWKQTYSPDHEKWLEQNYRKIVLDEKWRSLAAEEIARVYTHKSSREVFDGLLQMTSWPTGSRQAAP